MSDILDDDHILGFDFESDFSSRRHRINRATSPISLFDRPPQAPTHGDTSSSTSSANNTANPNGTSNLDAYERMENFDRLRRLAMSNSRTPTRPTSIIDDLLGDSIDANASSTTQSRESTSQSRNRSRYLEI